MKDVVDTVFASGALDIAYSLNDGITSAITSSKSVTIFGAGAPLELPITFFLVLMSFAEPKTVREAFQAIDVDVDIDDFGDVISGFVRHGLLRPYRRTDDGRGLDQMVNERLSADAECLGRVKAWMQQGRAIMIPDALPAELAEAAHRDLCQSKDWTIAEGCHDFFHYRACILRRLEDRSPALAECNRLFKCKATRSFIAELSGQDCAGEASAAAAWYRPNQYALPHDDTGRGEPRSVAYIWYLAKDWQREWGGALFWCPTGQYIAPRFNMLVMFRVMPSNLHFICPVAPTATAKRLTINGFWHRAIPTALRTPILSDGLVSPRVYGSAEAEPWELSSITAL